VYLLTHIFGISSSIDFQEMLKICEFLPNTGSPVCQVKNPPYCVSEISSNSTGGGLTGIRKDFTVLYDREYKSKLSLTYILV